MSIWDQLTGRRSGQTTTSSSQLSGSSPQSSYDEPFDTSNISDVSSFLGQPSLPDPTQLHPLAGLNQETLDYLTLEESTLSDLPGSRSVLPSRGWSDDLCYGTGVTYLAALSMGGAWGLAEGLNRAAPTTSPKLRLNSILNGVTRRGPFLGNSAGVLALSYNLANSFIGWMRGRHDGSNSIIAGALSGALFKCTRGIRPMMVSGGLVASTAAAWAVRLAPTDTL